MTCERASRHWRRTFLYMWMIQKTTDKSQMLNRLSHVDEVQYKRWNHYNVHHALKTWVTFRRHLEFFSLVPGFSQGRVFWGAGRGGVGRCRGWRGRERLWALGSFSNDDGDGNEDFKQAIGLDRQNNNVHHAVLYISLPSLQGCEVRKCLIASFMEDVNKRQRISFSLSKLECSPQEISSREIRLHLPFSANWNKRDKDWKKNGNSF